MAAVANTPQTRYGTMTVYRVRRRRALLVAALALLTATAFAAPLHLLGGGDRSSVLDRRGHSYLSTEGWPLSGQGAYVLGNRQPAASPHQQRVPVASVAKVMTAYLVVKHYPLSAGDGGPRFVVSQ